MTTRGAPPRQRPLSVGPLRAFEAVARLSSFRAAAEELSLSASAVSRQVQALEDEVGAPLLRRGSRHVELTPEGTSLLSAAVSALKRIDGSVRQIRQARSRRVVHVSTFASFASLWLLPRLEDFQQRHPDIDIRVSAQDALVDLEEGELDLALRHQRKATPTAGATWLFDEMLSPVASPALLAKGPGLRRLADLSRQTLVEDDDERRYDGSLSWRNWLVAQGQPQLQPRRWLYLSYAHQQVQTALAGQALALGRLAMCQQLLERGALVEPFGPELRTESPYAYWLLLSSQGRERPEVLQFAAWIAEQAEACRAAMQRLRG
ncbi:LysR substrate-binding domain-containing protein [Pelomonas sp. SE-A7]|uniref:LysR substrate-binding domain-containing protein n=1 Tax=Pelomonas sp. SE-A7 TaxID=3054953 RepID=UPI00259CA0A1|nr:LysR substrate-binding domain-containing protein [Pelomonas sp. SE-A7]MDM4766704.1 LysR substrate-binding domain-containing protein [Pelomonas sp. SE-A7]